MIPVIFCEDARVSTRLCLIAHFLASPSFLMKINGLGTLWREPTLIMLGWDI